MLGKKVACHEILTVLIIFHTSRGFVLRFSLLLLNCISIFHVNIIMSKFDERKGARDGESSFLLDCLESCQNKRVLIYD